MISTKSLMSLVVGAATMVGTVLPTPALANNANNVALNQMAMQMWMQQQATSQQQALLAQQQSIANYNAAQAAWAAQTVPQTTVNYVYPNNGYYNNRYTTPVYTQPVSNVVYTNPHPNWHHEYHHHWR